MKTVTVGLLLVVAAFSIMTGTVLAAQQPGSLVEPAQLKKWIDNGYRTEKGERVVIVDVVTVESDRDSWFAGNADTLKTMTARRYGERSPQYRLIGELDRRGALGHIPGAIISISHTGHEVTGRNDGPLEAEHEIGTGPLIDKLLRNSGITRGDVIVITSAKQIPWMSCPPRLVDPLLLGVPAGEDKTAARRQQGICALGLCSPKRNSDAACHAVDHQRLRAFSEAI